ncbi:hypothetical protein NESM_000186800 [Novymonas esmeraldas]|uniref:Uncharacterized protein n=1 Tax=Novymonas esmeraldas TaxID=1808958 RepID=A0AAW0F8C6_9TRYP
MVLTTTGGCATTEVVTAGELVDASTAAYATRHNLAGMTWSLSVALGGAAEGLHPPPTGPVESVVASAAATADVTLPLQVLLYSLGNASLPTSAATANKGSAKPVAARLGAAERGVDDATAAAEPLCCASAGTDSVWPVDAAFAAREDAVRAELCRCVSRYCERAHTGRGLVASFGGRLSWSRVTTGGDDVVDERVGVALALDVVRCWRQVAVPLLERMRAGLRTTDVADGSHPGEALFDCLVKRGSPHDESSVDASCKAQVATYELARYWCFALLCGYCHDVPETLWASMLCAAQTAAALEDAAQDGGNGAEDAPLSSETLLLRSFIAHLSCPAVEPAYAAATAAAVEVHSRTAVAAARARAEPRSWEEVELLHQTAATATAAPVDSLLAALLRSEAYWAIMAQPYTAMLAQHYL